MPYDNGNSTDFISESSPIGDYRSGSIYSDNLHDDFSILLSSNESGESGSESSENGESQVDYSEYSDILGSIYTNCSINTEQIESLSYQVDILNNNVCVLNENVKFGCGLIFTITFIVFVKTVFAVFNKVLGLNQA